MRRTVAVGQISKKGFETMKIDFEIYKDKAVVVIRDDKGNPIDRYESKQTEIKDFHLLTKAQVDAAKAARCN